MGGGEDLTWSVWQTQRGTETIPGEGGGTQMWSWRWWPVDKKGHGVGFDEEKIQMMTIMMIMMSMITLQSLWRRVDRPLPRDNTLDVRPLLRERSRNYILKSKTNEREVRWQNHKKNTSPCFISFNYEYAPIGGGRGWGRLLDETPTSEQLRCVQSWVRVSSV